MPNNINADTISIDDFAKVEIRLGTIIEVKEVEGSDKLYQLTVDFGETSTSEAREFSPLSLGEGLGVRPESKFRNVMSGIKKFKKAEDIINRQFPFVTNLAPRKMMGKYMSEAMILAASTDEDFSLFPSENKLPNGVRLT